ncbi:bifunctional diguanylate cyclase/phosphodiesterase [Actinoplanes sp. TFC3]|uniref:putative bifunctional diguanylate cyclase/phosphodiesterase n=1 Tax=Actinoplanes sp. TFC3 TaxID=1710355 RepID=UPI00082D8634|nr:EAL domain-containing protein [Actinoplanes sp. TFC3]
MRVGVQAFDSHEADYWTRQIRIGAAIAGFITILGAVRIALDWDRELRWFGIVFAVAAVFQGACYFLPWRRYVQNATVRRWLVLWWIAELPVLLVFGLKDPAGTDAYLPGAVLVMITLAALYTPQTVIKTGAGMLASYVVVLVASGRDLNPVSLATLVGMVGGVVGLNAVNAYNRRRIDGRRRSVEHRTEMLLEASSDAVLSLGVDGSVWYASPSVRTMLGHDPPSTRADLTRLVHREDLPRVSAWLSEIFGAGLGSTARMETRLRRGDGTWIYLDVIGVNRVADPDVQAVVISLRDIGTRRALEEQLGRQAFTDSLTGLPNRALFRDRLEQAVNGSVDVPVTVLLIDLDDFKLVNDNLGHSAGDDLLTEISGRLLAQMRPSDLLARLGGDEFAILIEDMTTAEAEHLAGRLLSEARRPTRLASRDITSTLSIGIATSLGAGDVRAEQLLRNADLAMYAAKRDGRDACAVFDPGMHHTVLQEAQQRADMERALAEEQFRVLYQPVVDMQTQRLIGAEALVRWQHPRDGLIGPYQFIGNAESSGLIVPLGRWVLRAACQQLASWQRDNPQAGHLRMNVNLSARQFQHANLVDDVAAAVAQAGIAPGALTLEITESMLMQDIDDAIATLEALRKVGVQLAIDDFGTGYSSLNYLRKLPVDTIKIDKSFVDQVHTNAGDVTLVSAIVGLCQALQLQTVAEGIETDEQWKTLRGIGCDHGQGYLFGAPAEAAEVIRLLDEHALR